MQGTASGQTHWCFVIICCRCEERDAGAHVLRQSAWPCALSEAKAALKRPIASLALQLKAGLAWQS